MTGLILPFYSDSLGISKSVLLTLACFPLVYSSYSFVCYLMKSQTSLMILTVMIANGFYCLITLGLILFYPGIQFWGYFFLISEIIVIFTVITIEWSIYKKYYQTLD